MNIETAMMLASAGIRSIDHVRSDRIDYPLGRLGKILLEPSGERYTVYRETALRDATGGEGAILVFRMSIQHAGLGTKTRLVLYHQLANIATPFFAGLPGFRRKLWLAGEPDGEFLELYEWATEADAKRLITVLAALLGPFDKLGVASYEIVPLESIESFVAETEYEWELEPAPARERKRYGYLLLLATLVAGGYLVWRAITRGFRSEQSDVK